MQSFEIIISHYSDNSLYIYIIQRSEKRKKTGSLWKGHHLSCLPILIHQSCNGQSRAVVEVIGIHNDVLFAEWAAGVLKNAKCSLLFCQIFQQCIIFMLFRIDDIATL